MSRKTIVHHEGKKVKHIRNKIFGWKQEVLADKLGVSQQAISVYENAEELDTTVRDKILSAFGISFEFFNNYRPETSEIRIENSAAFSVYGEGVTNTNNNPITEITKLTEKILNDKETLYKTFTSTLEELRTEIDNLRSTKNNGFNN